MALFTLARITQGKLGTQTLGRITLGRILLESDFTDTITSEELGGGFKRRKKKYKDDFNTRLHRILKEDEEFAELIIMLITSDTI